MDALAFIEKSAKAKPAPLYVLVGDEDFLRRLALSKLSTDLLDGADPSFAVSPFEGESARWPDVKSELDTLPFLSPRRLVVVEQADTFVTNNRAAIEGHAANSKSNGVLVLEMKSWPGNTRLAKQTPNEQTLQCETPPATRLATWCRDWAKQKYGVAIDADAARWLIELVGASMGLLDGELGKLASFVGDAKSIDREAVDAVAGHSREAEVFKIFDAIGAGNTETALAIFTRLMEQGEAPMAILGVFSYQLRKLGMISRGVRAGMSLRDAGIRQGVRDFALPGIEKQLRHLGRERMDRVYDWLIDLDMGMKGGNPLPDRLQLERLIIRLARPNEGAITRAPA